MTSQQSMILFLGFILIGLSVHEYWHGQLSALFSPVKAA